MNKVQQWQEAINTLPLGHYGRQEARESLAREYKEAHSVRLPYGRLDPTTAARFAGRLTSHFNLPRIKAIVLSSPEARLVAGLYTRKEIHFPTEYISLGTFLHEVAHHVKERGGFPGPSHGVGFVEALKLVLDFWEAGK